jgi:hypothetical protein
MIALPKIYTVYNSNPASELAGLAVLRRQKKIIIALRPWNYLREYLVVNALALTLASLNNDWPRSCLISEHSPGHKKTRS